MNGLDALRFLGNQAELCRSKEQHEAFCLLVPAVLRAFFLEPMGDGEAAQFKRQLKKILEGVGSVHELSRK